MSFRVVTQPATEPVSLGEMKEHMVIADSFTRDDESILFAIQASREYVEGNTGRQLITATFEMVLDGFWFGNQIIKIPRPPLISINTITYIDCNGVSTDLDSSLFQVDTIGSPGRIAPAFNCTWPSTRTRTLNAVNINYQAGYGIYESDVPEFYRHLIKMLVGHWYENREGTSAFDIREIPIGIKSLIWMRKVVHF